MRAFESAFRNAFLSNKGEEFKMDHSPTPALNSNDLRFYSTTISMRDKGGILFKATLIIEAFYLLDQIHCRKLG
jgi:hypothetical protein